MADTPAAPTTPTPAAPAAPAPAAPASAGPASPVYADAQAQIDAQNRAALAMITGATTAGNNATQAALTAGGADKGAAIKQLLGSALFGPSGGPGAAAPYAGMVGGAYDQRLGTTGDLGAAFTAAQGTRAAGADTYFKEASAALPVVQAETGQKIALAHEKTQAAYDAAQQKAQLAAQSQAMTLQLRQLEIQAAQDRAAKAAAPQTLGQFLTANGGPDLVGDQLLALAGPQVLPDALKRSTNDSTTSYAQGQDYLGNAIAGTPIPRTVAQSLMDNSQHLDATQNKPAAAVTGATKTAATADAVMALKGGTDSNGVTHPPMSRAQAIAAIDAKYGVGVGADIVGSIP